MFFFLFIFNFFLCHGSTKWLLVCSPCPPLQLLQKQDHSLISTTPSTPTLLMLCICLVFGVYLLLNLLAFECFLSGKNFTHNADKLQSIFFLPIFFAELVQSFSISLFFTIHTYQCVQELTESAYQAICYRFTMFLTEIVPHNWYCRFWKNSEWYFGFILCWAVIRIFINALHFDLLWFHVMNRFLLKFLYGKGIMP